METLENSLVVCAYLVSSVFFILSLRGLSSQETARRGNTYGVLGMAIAVVATIMVGSVGAYTWLIGSLAVGGAIGLYFAKRVAMTGMPELVALLHSFVGLAAVLVGIGAFLGGSHSGTIASIEIFVDVFIGAITFTGSVIAFLKLRGSLSGKPLLLPARHLINIALVIACVVLAVLFVQNAQGNSFLWLLVMATVAGFLGIHLVSAIGGADMPVVVSMLNSYSGWTAAAAGFMLHNNLLIVTGALVGSSGAILSYIMCRAMNRSIWNVIFGGFGTKSASVPSKTGGSDQERTVQETTTKETAARLLSAKSVMVVPGYGMAVARAQHAVEEMVELLRKANKQIRFAIHPVAGRLPGHMNVLLAEASVPYDIVFEMDEVNDGFPQVDVVLVIGANDIVNPGALTDESSPIYGMPVIEVWKSKHVVIMKRSRASGYAGVDNPLFYHPSAHLLFGDARDSMDSIVGHLKNR